MSELKLRRALKTDLPRIAELESLTFPPAEAASPEKYAWRLEHYPQYSFVGEIDKKVVSVVNTVPTTERLIFDDIYEMVDFPAGNTAGILSVLTDPEYQKKGYAGETLKYAIKELKDIGIKHFCLTCKEHLTHYYAKFGFQLQGESESVHGGAVWYDMTIE